MVSCEDSEIPVYSADDFISFKPDVKDTKTAFSFIGIPEIKQTDTLSIELHLIGNVADYDREVAIIVADSSSAKEGEDFKIQRPILLKKGAIKTNVEVVLFRTEDIKSTSKSIWLVIDNSDSLLKAERKDDLFETYGIEFSEDIESLVEPDWWRSRFSQFIYSKTRHLQYINEIGSSDDPTIAIEGLSLGDSYNYVLYKLQIATKLYNETHSDVLSDENGPITW